MKRKMKQMMETINAVKELNRKFGTTSPLMLDAQIIESVTLCEIICDVLNSQFGTKYKLDLNERSKIQNCMYVIKYNDEILFESVNAFSSILEFYNNEVRKNKLNFIMEKN